MKTTIAAFFALFVCFTFITFNSDAKKIKVKGTGGALLHPNGDVQLCPEEAENKVCAKIPMPSASSSLEIGQDYDVEILDAQEEVIQVIPYTLIAIDGNPDAEGDFNGLQLTWTEVEQ